MKIWEDDNQKYIKAMMEKNTTEQNEKLTKRLEEIDFSVLEHIERKEDCSEEGRKRSGHSGSKEGKGRC